MTQPGNAPRKRALLQRDLVAGFAKLDPRVKDALLVVLEVMVEIEDRRRAPRLLEAISLLVTMAPRRVPERTERRAR